MGRVGVAATVTLLAIVASTIAARAQDVFRVEVKLIRLLATVRDAAGAPVAGLQKSDFTIFDNGVKQEITVFERQSAQPLSVGIVLDASGSTAREKRYEHESVNKFLANLFGDSNPEDRAALYSFNWEVRRLVDYSSRVDPFARALKLLKSEAGTSLYDGIFLAAEDIQDRSGRHVLIVISDGGDTGSVKKYHDALRAAHAADAVIYGVIVLPVRNDPGRQIGGENAMFTLAQSTGGKVFYPDPQGLDNAFQEILSDLRTQYMIGYHAKGIAPTRDPFHKVTVKTSRPELRVMTRTGYYEDAASGPRD